MTLLKETDVIALSDDIRNSAVWFTDDIAQSDVIRISQKNPIFVQSKNFGCLNLIWIW